MDKQKKLQKNLILNVIKSIMTIIFPLITYKYASIVLLPTGIGKYNYATSIISYFQMLATLGINTYAITEGSKIRDNSTEFKKFVEEVFSLNIITTLISYTFLLILILLDFGSIDNRLILICSCSILLNTMGVGWICNIFEDFTYITLRTIGIQALSLVLMFLCVKSPDDLYKYAIISVFASYGWNLFNVFYVKKFVKFSIIKISKAIICKHIKPILLLFCASASSTIYMNADKTMIGSILGDAPVGIYTSAVKIITVVTTIVVAIREVFLPQIANNVAKNDTKDANALISNGLSLIIKFVIPCLIGIFICELLMKVTLP